MLVSCLCTQNLLRNARFDVLIKKLSRADAEGQPGTLEKSSEERATITGCLQEAKYPFTYYAMRRLTSF
jgi:hypothetical protein